MPLCTPRSCLSACREDTGCTARTYLSACHEDTGCTARTYLSAFHASTAFLQLSPYDHHVVRRRASRSEKQRLFCWRIFFCTLPPSRKSRKEATFPCPKGRDAPHFPTDAIALLIDDARGRPLRADEPELTARQAQALSGFSRGNCSSSGRRVFVFDSRGKPFVFPRGVHAEHAEVRANKTTVVVRVRHQRRRGANRRWYHANDAPVGPAVRPSHTGSDRQ